MQVFLQEKKFLEFAKTQISDVSEDNSFSMLPVKYLKKFIFRDYYYNTIYDALFNSKFYLQNETILKILEYLDLKSLYHICNVNKYFNILARDFTLYKCLNLKPYWYSFNGNALNSLISRCKYLQQLDLSWCGNYNVLTSTNLNDFLKQCGSLLTHLRLNCCKIVDDSVTLEISLTCKNLKGTWYISTIANKI